MINHSLEILFSDKFIQFSLHPADTHETRFHIHVSMIIIILINSKIIDRQRRFHKAPSR